VNPLIQLTVKISLILVPVVSWAGNSNEAWFDSARRGDLVKITKLSAHTKVDTVDSAGESALILASEAGFSSVVDYLLAKKANVNLQDKAGNSALVYAILNGFDDLAIRLLQSGADVSLANSKEGNALNVAAKAGRTKVVLALVASHGDLLNQANKEGETPLFTAIREAHFALAEKMIHLGSKTDIKNNKGQGLLEVAKASGVPEGHTLLKTLSASDAPNVSK
jgi:serine/threonine-protein phosphatase 6 regulatory ankyrin repeat subunit B